MITFSTVPRKLEPVSPRAANFPPEPTPSAWFLETPARRLESLAADGFRRDENHVEADAVILDALVSDLSILAKCYLNEGEPGDEPGVLDAVCNLLGSALERMRTSASARTAANEAAPAPARPRGGIAPSALRRVREHIDLNLGEHLEIADLANLTGLSPCHFSRAFKQSMGMPPHRYLINRRVQEAARLIETTDRPMFEIALDVGFSDQSHFTRVFSAQVGESPSQFRHQRR